MEKKDLRIVFMGTPEFAVGTLRKLVEGGYMSLSLSLIYIYIYRARALKMKVIEIRFESDLNPI